MQTQLYHSIKHRGQNASHQRKKVFPLLNTFFLALICLFMTSVLSAQTWTQRSTDLDGVSGEGLGVSVSLSADGSTMAIGNNDDDVSANSPRSSVKVKTWNGTAWVQKGSTLYGEQDGNNFGFSVSLSADGETLAVGAHTHSDIALYGAFSNSGRAYVYDWSGIDWVLRGDVLIANAAQENFGNSVSLSADGNVLGVGAPGANGGGTLRGLVRVYKWTGSAWQKIGNDILGGTNFENLGTSVSLRVTAMDSVLAAGGPSFTPSPGNDYVGLVKIFRHSEGSWRGSWSSPKVLTGYNTGDYFGYSVSLSNDGNRLAIGAPTNGFFSVQLIGYARIFDYAAGSFTQVGTDIISNIEYDNFGDKLALSGNGQFVIIGARGGVGNENGRAEIYTYNAATWQQVDSDIIGEGQDDLFGQAVAINETGTVIAIGGSANDGGGADAGNVRTFTQACAPPAAPGGDATQVLCGSSVVFQLTATGTNIKWYDAATEGSLLNPLTVLVNNATYYASQTINDCESTDRFAVTVELLPIPAQPVSEVTQPTCSLATGTITVTEQNAGETYSFNNGVDFQASNSMAGLDPGDYQIIIKGTNGCASPAASVTVNAQPLPPANPIVQVTQPTCTVSTGTITVTVQQAGESYSFNNGTDFQSSNSKSGLTAGDYQVLIKSAAGCISASTTATITAAPSIPNAATGNTEQAFCSAATVAQLTATGTAIQWYATETGGTPLATTTALTNNTTYYASQTVGCESTSRLAVAVTVNTTTVPTGEATQTFCTSEATVAELTATAPETISWYTTPTGGTPLAASQVLTKGTYYAGYSKNGCESARLAVAVDYAFFWNTISAEINHTLGIKQEGTLWAWGDNKYGQLGDGTNTNRNSPVQIGSDKWTSITAGYKHTLGIKQDSTLWAWGNNESAQLGDGTYTNRNTPVQIGTGKWISVTAGYLHTLGIKQDSTLWAWGENDDGQLGDGTNTNRYTPVQIGTGKWTSITAGYYHTLGIKQDGTLWAWGNNIFGELGDGTNTNRNTPVQIGTGKWTSITAGYRHTLGIKQEGTLWAWGDNYTGQLGEGSYANRNTPVQIGSDKWTSMTAGAAHTLGIKQEGTLWAWGNNVFGQLGDDTYTNTTTPVQIGTGKWISVTAGYLHTLGIKQEGTLWAWGFNDYGQLGDGTATYKSTPTRLGGVAPVLPQPTLTVDFTNDSQPLLTTSGGSEYVWHKNRNVIEGANESTYAVPSEDGEGLYTVATIGTGGCRSPLSNEVPIYITALDFEPEASIQLYPNPAQESLLVKVAEQAQFSVVSMNGHVQRISTEWLSNEQAHRVHIKDLISGMYILQIQQNGKRAQVKFIKQ